MKLPQIRNLILHSVGDLKHIWKQQDSQLPYLGRLDVEFCDNLINLAQALVSFQNLTTLKLKGCDELLNLVTSSTAKSMVQLMTMEISKCQKLTEIIADDGTTEEIIFSKLKTLRLLDLRSLTSFCSGNYTLRFSRLDEVVVETCPNMKTFSNGALFTPKLVNLQSSMAKWNCKGDLNATIQHLYMEMVGFHGLEELKLSEFPLLIAKWHGQLPFKYFSYLERLEVDNCASFSNAIASNLLKSLENLIMLVVEKCDLLKEVFYLEGLNPADIDRHVGLMSQLDELHLIDLPNLRHVWNKDPRVILDFNNLSSLKVHNCSTLKYIFTVSMALSLVNLYQVEIKGCRLVEEIITNEEEEEAVLDKPIFSSLYSINLESLPVLISFYSRSDLLECPSLKRIDVVDCPKMVIFASTLPREQDSSKIVEENFGTLVLRFFSGKVAIPNVEGLRVDWNDAMKEMMWHEKFQADYFCRLKVIELMHFPGDCAFLPLDFLQKFSNLEELVLSDASFEEISHHEVNIGGKKHSGPLAQLRKLRLSNLPDLRHLMTSLLSFQNLTSLEVSKCHGLINLMTSSTARSLVQLKTMLIAKCETMQEIISSEGDGVEDEICFSQLENLVFYCLPALTCFYSGNCVINFPSLEGVFVSECASMKIFAKEVVNTPKLKKMQTGEYEGEWCWEGSLNKNYTDVVP